MQKKQVEKLFALLREHTPEPKTELVFENSFQLLVAVVLSAHTTDVQVNQATKVLFARVKSPRHLLDLAPSELKNMIKCVGLHNTKARHLQELSAQLIERHKSQVPSTLGELKALSGVGQKTAQVVLNTVFKVPSIAVDTHVFRVANRTGLSPGRTPLQVERGLLQIVPEAYLHNAHHWLILHGRYTCQARKPQCDRCVIKAQCHYEHKTA